jgi:hypothetical protein
MKQYTKSKFAQEIRSKYPGSYDDLTDDKLIELWLRKFPLDKNKIAGEKIINFKYLKWFNIITLLFLSNIVPIYVFYHPGLLFYPNPSHFYHTDSWPVIFCFVAIILVFAIINFKIKLYLISSTVSIAYIIGLYFYPINYFKFYESFNHHLSQECIVYSTIIIVYNFILALNTFKNKNV